MVLNSWEQKEYKGDGWIKFKGENGSCWGTEQDGSAFDGDGTNGSVVKGSFIQGYYNAKTHQIQFIVNYSDCIYNHRTTKTNQKYPSVNL